MFLLLEEKRKSLNNWFKKHTPGMDFSDWGVFFMFIFGIILIFLILKEEKLEKKVSAIILWFTGLMIMQYTKETHFLKDVTRKQLDLNRNQETKRKKKVLEQLRGEIEFNYTITSAFFLRDQELSSFHLNLYIKDIFQKSFIKSGMKNEFGFGFNFNSYDVALREAVLVDIPSLLHSRIKEIYRYLELINEIKKLPEGEELNVLKDRLIYVAYLSKIVIENFDRNQKELSEIFKEEDKKFNKQKKELEKEREQRKKEAEKWIETLRRNTYSTEKKIINSSKRKKYTKRWWAE